MFHLPHHRHGSRPRRSLGRTLTAGCEPLEPRLLLAGDPVLTWNDVALDAVKNDFALGVKPDQPGPSGSARALAMVHVAIYDAVVAIDRHYMPYLHDFHAAAGASVDAAVAQAAHDTLAALFPQQKATFDTALTTSLAGIPAAGRDAGVALGAEAAAACITSREGDGAVANMSFTPGTQPGDWRPDPLHPNQIAWGPNWGDVKPFKITSAADFAMPPVPAMSSQEYTDAYNEVKTLGGDGVNSPTTRTADQIEIGIFWGYDGTPGLGTPPRLYNQAARVIAEQEGNTVMENARLFAMVNVAMSDAGVASWDTKFIENFWRPITAIRESDPGTGPSGLGDGNPNTVGDPNWTPLGSPADNGFGTNFTPPFPAYTSGHATFGAAAFGAIREFYGTDDIAFDLGSDEYNGITKDANGQVRPVRTRHYDNLSEAIEENGISRIYLGIHWRFDMEEGITQGTNISKYVAGHFAIRTPTMQMFLASNLALPSSTSSIQAAPAAAVALTSTVTDSTSEEAAPAAAPEADPPVVPAAVDEALSQDTFDAPSEDSSDPIAEPAAAAETPAAPTGQATLDSIAFANAVSSAQAAPDPSEIRLDSFLASARRR